MKPSQEHPNRRIHNWLIYDVGDRFLEKHRSLYRGHLYDLGCGDKPFEGYFLRYCEKYLGVDWNDAADLHADLNKPLNVADEVADTVVSISAMEHLKEPQLFVREAFRILKPGGHVIVHVPFLWHVHEAPHDYFRFTRYGLDHLFRIAGFADIAIEPTTGFWTMWLLKLNYQLIRLVRGPAVIRWMPEIVIGGVCWLNQVLAKMLDCIWTENNESAGYVVTARKC